MISLIDLSVFYFALEQGEEFDKSDVITALAPTKRLILIKTIICETFLFSVFTC